MDAASAIPILISREANSWSGRLPSLGVEVSGGSYFTLAKRAKEAAAAALGCATTDVSLQHQMELEGVYLQARQSYDAAMKAQEEARLARIQTAAVEARRLMDQQGLSLRDAAAVLGMRHSDLALAFKKVEALKAS